ncbi:enoyl-CoA hydratase/isomerase family protein [Priestia megaterium]|nr:enoyl-CoA hydratase/isomerase family protein [Priestia megaterium]
MNVFVDVEKKKDVAIVRINQAMLNRMDSEAMYELQEAVTKLQADSSIHSLVFRGEMYRTDRSAKTMSGIREKLGQLYNPVHSVTARAVFQQVACSSKRTVAVLNSFTFGGGYELAQACDVRIARSSVQIKQPTGQIISAQQAKANGSIQHIMDDHESLPLTLDQLEQEA